MCPAQRRLAQASGATGLALAAARRYDAVVEVDLEQRVVARGPFTLKPSFARDQWLVGGFAILFLTAVGPVMIAVHHFYGRHLQDLERRWSAYRAAAEPAAYEGSIRTSRLFTHRYNLRVSSRTQEGAPIAFETSFSRFFTGPEDGDALYVRYDPAAPNDALTSWEFESTHAGHYYANGALIIGLLSLLVGGLFVRDVRRRVVAITALASEGQLVLATVEQHRQVGTKSLPMLQITLRLPGGVVQTQVFYARSGPPYLVDNASGVLVLSSLDEQTVHILREDGYPLVERPRLNETTA
jgi:hypothetical protein